jgi:hypothetical protein
MSIEKLYEELAGGAAQVRILLAGMTQAEAAYKPSPEARSALEVLCHLYDEEREDFRRRLDLMLHHPTEAWPPNDPEGWVTARRYNERDLAESLEAFVQERNQSVAWLKGLAAPNWEVEFPTPFGTTMKAGDMLAAWVAHDNLHVRQLVELRRARILNLCQPYDVRYAGEW